MSGLCILGGARVSLVPQGVFDSLPIFFLSGGLHFIFSQNSNSWDMDFILMINDDFGRFGVKWIWLRYELKIIRHMSNIWFCSVAWGCNEFKKKHIPISSILFKISLNWGVGKIQINNYLFG